MYNKSVYMYMGVYNLHKNEINNSVNEKSREIKEVIM